MQWRDTYSTALRVHGFSFTRMRGLRRCTSSQVGMSRRSRHGDASRVSYTNGLDLAAPRAPDAVATESAAREKSVD